MQHTLPLAPQVRGFLSALQWKRTSQPERSPHFVWDVKQPKPPASVGEDDVLVTLICNWSTDRPLVPDGDTGLLAGGELLRRRSAKTKLDYFSPPCL
jgi:hypothetical protein